MYLLAATAPLEVYRTAVAGFDVSLFRLSLLFSMSVLLVTSGGQRRGLIRWLRHPLVATYVLLGALTLVALLVHPINSFLGVREAAQIGIGVVAIVVIGELARGESTEQLARVIVIGAVLPILGAAWSALVPKLGGGEELPLLSHLPAAPGLEVTRQALSSFGPIGARAKGTFGDPNHFGVYLVFVLYLAVALTVLAGRRRDRAAQVSFGAVGVAAAATVLATFSRSAWIAALIGIPIVTVGLVKAWRTGVLTPPTKRVAALVIVGVLALAAPVAPSVVERALPSSAINVVSDRGHESTVRFAFDQFIAHPVIGIGPGGLGVKLNQGVRTSGALCTYLTIAAEVGIMGLLCLLCAAAVALRLLARACRLHRGTHLAVLPIAFAAAYVGLLGANVTYDVWFDDFHWLILGVVAAIGARASAAREPFKTETPVGVGVHDSRLDGYLDGSAGRLRIARDGRPV